MTRAMDDVVADDTSVTTPSASWLNLGALVTDEVAIIEAQAAGMDWPDLAEGRTRLVNTRRAIVGVALKQGWIATQESWLLLGPIRRRCSRRPARGSSASSSGSSARRSRPRGADPAIGARPVRPASRSRAPAAGS
jgi:hypothetical protein